MLGMLLALSAPARDIRHGFPNVLVWTFVVDRSFAASTAREALEVKAALARWSQLLGLQENVSKTAHFHRRVRVGWISWVEGSRLTRSPLPPKS